MNRSEVLGKRSRKVLADVVRDELRQRIEDGEYSPGEKLPSEAELSLAHEVSRVTLREAIRGLVEEGYVTRYHGLGTFVTKRPRLRNNLDVNFGVTQLIETLGMQPGNRDVVIVEEDASERVAHALGLRRGDRVVRIERLRTANGDPLVYSVEFVPKGILRVGVEDFEDLTGSLYDLLATLGHPIAHGVAQLKIATADQTTAQKLGVRAGAALLFMEQVDVDHEDTPCLFALEWYRGEDLELTVYRKGPLGQ